MPTRGQIAREAASLSNSIVPETHAKSSTKQNILPKTKHVTKANTKKPRGKMATNDEIENEEDSIMKDVNADSEDPEEPINVQLPSPVASGKKRKRAASRKTGQVNGEAVTGGWDELPHNMGKMNGATTDGVTQLEDTIVAPESASKRSRTSRTLKAKDDEDTKDESLKSEDIRTAAPKQKEPAPRGKAKKNAPATPQSSVEDEDAIVAEVKEEEGEEPKMKRASRAKKVVKTEDVQEKVADLLDAADKPTRKMKKPKKNPYGLTPGETPFSEFLEPTPEACQKVNDLLAGLHGEVKQPEKVPAPSLEVSGCGEVPSVLDAMIRTLLSAATTGLNSSRAFQGLIERYGKLEEGIGKGSVNWYKVHESSVSDVFEAIKSGGLAKVKSQRIKAVLDLVYKQNVARRNAFIKEKESGISVSVAGANLETQGQKDLEIAKADNNVLSLDHLHALSSEDVMVELTKFPGIGVKTASCVLLFCMQRPSFAVDTHVWRLCKWLKWVPEGATRDQTFSHCEIRIPDHLKYSLHQLFIRHGKTCGRCRANTGTKSQDFIEANCPIDDLVTRTGKRKDEGAPTGPRKKSGGKKKKGEEWDSEAHEDEESPEPSDDEESE